MTEFVNRMAAQRRLLRVVNARQWNEELFGLSLSAIKRWAGANQLRRESAEVDIVMAAAEALSFLATRSQEQVSDDYEHACAEVTRLTLHLEKHFEALAITQLSSSPGAVASL
jgi:hypothetical protein